MVIRNWYLFASIILIFVTILPVLFYVIPKQYSELVKQRRNRTWPDRVTFIGRSLLTLQIMFVIGSIPGLPRSLQLLDTPPANNYAKVASITNRIPPLVAMMTLVIMYYVGTLGSKKVK